jgi:hypothetical protein
MAPLLRILGAGIVLVALASHAHAQQAGVRWTGAAAATRTTADLLAAEAADPLPAVAAREALPGRTIPNAAARRTNPASPVHPSSQRNPHQAAPTAIDGPTAARVAGVAQSFPGISFAQSGGFVPPDAHGDVGPAQVLAAVNARLRTIDKATGAPDGVLDVGANTFFGPVRGASTVSSQRVIFDRLARRWLIVAITTSLPNRILIAASDGALITSSSAWSLFQFQQDLVTPVGNDTGLLCDFPNAGVDAHAIYVGCDMFGAADYFGSSLFVVNKASVLNGGPIVVTVFRDLLGAMPNPTGPGPNTPKGVTNFDPAATDGYFIGEDNQALGQLDLVRILDPGGTPAMLSFSPITTAAFQTPVPVEHLGNDHPTGAGSGLLDGGDNRVTSAQMRAGTIWLAHTTAVDATGNGGTPAADRNAVRWYQIGSPAVSPTILQSGTIFDPTSAQRSYVYGAMDVNGQGHAAFGFSLAGPGDYAGVAADGRLLTDPSGTTQGAELATVGLAAYVETFDQGQFLPGGVRRWGRVSNTLVDPDDDMTFWTIQEYADADGTWATRIVRLLAPPPATPIAVTPSTIPAGQPSVLINVTGQSVGGSGFFDPGPGYAKRLGASIPGLAINGIVYHGPLAVTLDVSTTNSPVGSRNVTLLNPDGQSATAVGLLTVGAPGGSDATTTTVDSALNPATVGQDVTFVASVAPVPPATGAPSGTVTFRDGVTTLGSAPLAAGTATLATSTLAPGSHAIVATYEGDASFYGSHSSPIAQQIAAAPAVVVVTNTNDTGTGSLRGAIAGAAPGATILFDLVCGSTIRLASGPLIVDKALSIAGPGARCLTVSGNNASRVFGITVPGVDVGLSGMTITQGRATGGGGLQNLGANLGLTDLAIVGNNALGGAGGGLDHEGGTLRIVGSTISGNQSTFRGGGLQIGGGDATIVNSTITGNVSVRGGGLRSAGGAKVTLVHATVSHNSASGAGSGGGNVSALNGTVMLQNSIVAQGSGTDPDLDPAGGTYLSLDYNLIESGTFAAAAHDVTGMNPSLDPPANNGGPTDTRMPHAGSAAIDAVPAAGGCNGAAALFDQRGLPRPQGSGCDVGAAETGPAIGSAVTTIVIGASSDTSAGGGTVDFSATVSGSSPTGAVIFYDGAVILGAGTLSAGSATLSVSTLSAGTHAITARYTGDAANAQSTSAPLVHGVVNAASSIAVVASVNPAAPGASVTFTATVSPPPASAEPTGSVLFFDGGALLGVVALEGGVAALVTDELTAPGTHDITAVYAGSVLYNGSSSPVLREIVTGGAATTTTLASSLNPSVVGNAVTFTATVSAPGGTPSGTVEFMDGPATLGSATLATGAASLATSALTTGPHSIVAVYAGDGAFPGSASSVLVQAVTVAGAALERTFVSAGGADSNPCTLPSPCRTIATAMAATASGGEVIIVDSADYGPAVIAKPISLIAPPGVFAGITVTAGTGIVVNPGSGTVRVRGLTISGLGGATGIDFQSGDALYLEDSVISGFTGAGLAASAAAPAELFVRDTYFRGNGSGAALAAGAGIVTPLAATIERAHFEDNGTGIALTGSSARAVIVDSLVVNGGVGILVQPTVGGAVTTADVRGTTVSRHTTAGIVVGGNGAATGALSASGSQIVENGIGLDVQAGGAAHVTDTTVARNAIGLRGPLVSLGDNRLVGNGVDGGFIVSLPKQ